MVNNGGLFCEVEINVLMGQRSAAVVIKAASAVGGVWYLGEKCVSGTNPHPSVG